jgi:rhamnose utilization protein RhaD (predicted bifunctional aldolase and dehydrogenase)
VTAQPVELLWVKGSGGDLGTLREAGLAVLRLDRLRALTGVYPGVEREDEMVAAFDFCLHGRGGAAPSIDTAMHGLVEAPHVDHLHPDSGIALATAADGEALTKECFGDRVVWVPWRRRASSSASTSRRSRRRTRRRSAASWAGHGVTAWGETVRAVRGSGRWRSSARRSVPRRARARRAVRPGRARLRAAARGRAPRPGGGARRRCCGASRPPTRGRSGHFSDSDVVLDFLSREKLPPLAALGTSCPDHFLRTKVRPLVVDLPATATLEQVLERLPQLHAEYREAYRAYYERHATPDSPPMRGADPAVVLVPGVGMFSYGKDKQTARVAGEFYTNAINVMRGAEAVSTYAPIDEVEKFRIEYWELEEAKLRRMPRPKPLATRWRSSPGPDLASARPSPSASRPRVPAWSSPTGTPRQRSPLPRGSAARTWPWRSRSTSPTSSRWPRRSRRPRWRSAGGPGGEQRRLVRVEAAARDERGRLGPAARRHGEGSFLSPGEPPAS